MISFLAPALLVGLAAIAVPILVHLVQREKRRVVEFPSLMFLRKIPYQSVRRRAIRHWPLLALRILALAAIALAFARPFLRGAAMSATSGSSAREVVILLDRSFSMGYRDHWTRATDEARSAVRALGANDRATLALFDAEVEVIVRSSAERGALLNAIDRARPSAGATRLGPALRAAAGLLESAGAGRREVVLISDFQQTGWDRAQDYRLPPGVSLVTKAVVDSTNDNAAVAGLTLERSGRVGREQIVVTAKVANHGQAQVSDRTISLEVDGRRVQSRGASVPPRSATMVPFAPVAIGTSAAKVVVRLEQDALPGDDSFRAMIAPAAPIPVLVLESVNPAPDSSLYLTGALAVGRTPPFGVSVAGVDRVTPDQIHAASVILLNDSRPPIGAAGRALESRVRAGGGLLIVLGGQGDWPTGAPDLLPGSLQGSIDRAGTRGGSLGHIDYSHPVFEIFRQPRSGDLTSPRVFRYRQLTPSGPVVARFDDGGAALVERRIDRGIVLAWTSTLDSHWNDLALKPVFVPLVHEAVKHLARYVEPKAWQTVGETLDAGGLAAMVGPQSGADAEGLVAVAPDGGRHPFEREKTDAGVRADVSSSESRAPFRPLPLTEPGFYAIRPAAAGSSELAAVAVNPSTAESDLAALDPADLARAVVAAPVAGEEAGGPRTLGAGELERRQSVWWYLLAGGLALLVIEGLLSSRLPRVA